jgi:murein tripeptide amidase MpaA
MIKDVIQHNYEHVDVKWELAAKSELGNAIVCLRISKKGKFASKEVIITARQHPSESVGSFVCDSIISILVSNSPLCRSLLERFTFIILPMINPDGVVHGNSRTSAMGYDLNRCWNNKGVTYSK